MVMVLFAQAMFPRYLVNQSILRMTSIPWDFNTTRLVGNTTPLRLIGMLITPRWHWMWPPEDLVIRGRFKVTVGISWVSMKCKEMNEWEAPESKSIVTRKDWTRNSPSTTPDASSASSAYTWLTLAFPKDGWVLEGAPRVIPVICFGPLTELEKTDGVAFLYGQLAMKCPVSLQLKQVFGLVTWVPHACCCWKDPWVFVGAIGGLYDTVEPNKRPCCSSSVQRRWDVVASWSSPGDMPSCLQISSFYPTSHPACSSP
jgi:hypothetical protein